MQRTTGWGLQSELAYGHRLGQLLNTFSSRIKASLVQRCDLGELTLDLST